jgi:hypothetical protein
MEHFLALRLTQIIADKNLAQEKKVDLIIIIPIYKLNFLPVFGNVTTRLILLLVAYIKTPLTKLNDKTICK